VAPFEGRYRYVGYDVIYAVRLALREANAAGGVEGYSVELVAYDDGADPAMAAEQTRKLAVDPQVVAAIGHFREETTAAALGAYGESGIPLVSPGVRDRALALSEATVYGLGPWDGALTSALFGRLKGLGQYRAALVTRGGALGAALERDAQMYRVALLPIVSPDDADWLEQVLDSGVETVFCDADPVMAGEVALALREAGWEGGFLGGPELAAADFSAVAGVAAEGAVFVTPYPFPADVPGSADFVAAYQALGPHVPPPGPLALPAYEATWVLLQALEQDIAAHGAPTRAGVTAALATVRRQGLLGWVEFDSGRNWGAAPLYWYRIGAGGVPERVS
jgi:branched-chain amino acid transport system substrate-binding protein